MAKSTEEKIAVMQAHADGKPVESSLIKDNIYSPVTDPNWNWGLYDYRVVEEPMVVYLNIYSDTNGTRMHPHTSKADAEHNAGNVATLVKKGVKFIEVIEEN